MIRLLLAAMITAILTAASALAAKQECPSGPLKLELKLNTLTVAEPYSQEVKLSLREKREKGKPVGEIVRTSGGSTDIDENRCTAWMKLSGSQIEKTFNEMNKPLSAKEKKLVCDKVGVAVLERGGRKKEAKVCISNSKITPRSEAFRKLYETTEYFGAFK